MDTAFKRWGARNVVEYATEDELVVIYRTRADVFTRVADDPSRSGICGADPLSAQPEDIPEFRSAPLLRMTARAFARRHVGQAPWVPPFDPNRDKQAWGEFFEYLHENGFDDLADARVAVSEGTLVPERDACLANASPYRLAADRPQVRAGSVRIIDFVALTCWYSVPRNEPSSPDWPLVAAARLTREIVTFRDDNPTSTGRRLISGL